MQNVPAGLDVFSELAMKWSFARQMCSASCALTDGNTQKKDELVESGNGNGIKPTSKTG